MSRQLSARAKKPTINDVARVSGLSKKTVSRVLNNSPQVAENTRRKVAAVIEELGFSPDPQARSLASKRSYTLGLVYDNPNALYISDIQIGVLRACKGTGYELIMHPGDFSNRKLLEEIEGFVGRARIGGLILLSPISQRNALAQRLRSDGIPYVRISPRKIDAESRIVVSNDRLGAEMMTEYLVSLGHRFIGFVSGPGSNLSAREKYAGFCSVMRENGLTVPETFVAKGENTFESGVDAGHFLLDREHRPSVVFASNDAMALGVLKSAVMLGMRVPEDLSVAGFDDSALATVTWPDLTTIRQPVERMGEIAARKLLAQLRSDVEPVELPLATEPKLVIRHSTGRHS
ncbi:MAG: LacI family DNA-binding transcriptional regulator [Gammaproteobacteria bacterium]|nr:LacI family DNA-binding transcriptional regulator [Gammaproteobacteria bacterium]MBT8051037.1 LacI family DNA-binding transcriptional regulator [Gammaproteobacteria bacterium]NNJ80387.1 LacI family DNA-binding transcriptional regulator [Xanthomonadales bacterium]